MVTQFDMKVGSEILLVHLILQVDIYVMGIYSTLLAKFKR